MSESTARPHFVFLFPLNFINFQMIHHRTKKIIRIKTAEKLHELKTPWCIWELYILNKTGYVLKSVSLIKAVLFFNSDVYNPNTCGVSVASSGYWIVTFSCDAAWQSFNDIRSVVELTNTQKYISSLLWTFDVFAYCTVEGWDVTSFNYRLTDREIIHCRI